MFDSYVSQKIELEDGNVVIKSPINARDMTISFSGEYNIIKEGSKIIELDIYSEQIKLGQTLRIITNYQDYYYKVGVINKVVLDPNSTLIVFLISFAKVTNSNHFLLPAVAEKTWMLKHLINSYLWVDFDDLIIENKNPVIYLYYRYDGRKPFYDWESSLSENNAIKQVINIDDLSILIVAEVPDRFLKDYKIILESKYSQISVELKNKIVDFYNYEDGSIMHNVLSRSNNRRKNLERKYGTKIDSQTELWEAIDEDSETFSIDMLTQIEKTI